MTGTTVGRIGYKVKYRVDEINSGILDSNYLLPALGIAMKPTKLLSPLLRVCFVLLW
jgi:hypothetical protein